MSSGNDKAQIFRMLEQPCALRPPEAFADRCRPGRAYDFVLPDSDYDAAGCGAGGDGNPIDPPQQAAKARQDTSR